MKAVNESCYQGDDSVLKSLVEIADTAPKYLRPNLEATLQLSLKVTLKRQRLSTLFSMSQHESPEPMICLCEYRKCKYMSKQ